MHRVFDNLDPWMTATAIQQTGRATGPLPTALSAMLDAVQRDPGAQKVAAGTAQTLKTRALVDYISSLTEVQAIDLHARLNGQSTPSALAGWLLA